MQNWENIIWKDVQLYCNRWQIFFCDQFLSVYYYHIFILIIRVLFCCLKVMKHVNLTLIISELAFLLQDNPKIRHEDFMSKVYLNRHYKANLAIMNGFKILINDLDSKSHAPNLMNHLQIYYLYRNIIRVLNGSGDLDFESLELEVLCELLVKMSHLISLLNTLNLVTFVYYCCQNMVRRHYHCQIVRQVSFYLISASLWLIYFI